MLHCLLTSLFSDLLHTWVTSLRCWMMSRCFCLAAMSDDAGKQWECCWLTNRLQEAGNLRQTVAKEDPVMVQVQGHLCSCACEVLLKQLLIAGVDLQKA